MADETGTPLPQMPNPTSQREIEELRGWVTAVQRQLDARSEEVLNKQLVWIENPGGVRDVVDMGYWRSYLRREEGYRLLSPDEVKDEQQKVAQSHAARLSGQARGRDVELEGLKVEELRAKLGELEDLLQKKGRGR